MFFFLSRWYRYIPTDYRHQQPTALYLRWQDLRRKVRDVGRDGPARQELSHLVGEGVAIVLEQAVPVTSETGWKQKPVNTPGNVFHASANLLVTRKNELKEDATAPVCAFS